LNGEKKVLLLSNDIGSNQGVTRVYILHTDKFIRMKMTNQTQETEKMQSAQFLQEINFKLGLSPALSQKDKTIPELTDSIVAVQVVK